jgi:hypothetical protein
MRDAASVQAAPAGPEARAVHSAMARLTGGRRADHAVSS